MSTRAPIAALVVIVAGLLCTFVVLHRVYWACPLRLLGSEWFCLQGTALQLEAMGSADDEGMVTIPDTEQSVDLRTVLTEFERDFRVWGRLVRPDDVARVLFDDPVEYTFVSILIRLPGAPGGERQVATEYMLRTLQNQNLVLVGHTYSIVETDARLE